MVTKTEAKNYTHAYSSTVWFPLILSGSLWTFFCLWINCYVEFKLLYAGYFCVLCSWFMHIMVL